MSLDIGELHASVKHLHLIEGGELVPAEFQIKRGGDVQQRFC